MKIIPFAALIAICQAFTPSGITGPTPPAIVCYDSLCKGKINGNYNYEYYGRREPNYFVQCIDEQAQCQACWPINLEFSQRCNQCLHKESDDCVTTKKWLPATTFECPDKCPDRGRHFSGNIEDPFNSHHYVACDKGKTVGCVACPEGLEFNEKWNTCLYKGEFKTKKKH